VAVRDTDFAGLFRTALFSSALSTLAPVGAALNYRDGDGNICGDFLAETAIG
jgi:hypothetical protein